MAACWIKLAALLLFVADICHSYEIGVCNCHKFPDAYIKSIIKMANMPEQDYQYLSVEQVHPGHDGRPGVMEKCYCDDVTRVQVVLVIDEEWARKGLIEGHNEYIAESVTDAMTSAMEKSDFLVVSKVLANILTKTVKSSNSGLIYVHVEVVLKTHEIQGATLVSHMLDDVIEKGKLPGIGSVEIKFKVSQLECFADPPDALDHGQRSWENHKIVGSKATYTCNTGYRLSDGSVSFTISCRDDTFKWEFLSDGLHCYKVPPCEENPWAIPNAFYTPAVPSLDEGAEVTYQCLEKFVATKVGHLTSRCNYPSWTSPGFYCVSKETCVYPPPIISNSNNTWGGVPMPEESMIEYHCIENYSSTTGNPAKMECVDGQWGALHDWHCNILTS